MWKLDSKKWKHSRPVVLAMTVVAACLGVLLHRLALQTHATSNKALPSPWGDSENIEFFGPPPSASVAAHFESGRQQILQKKSQ